MKIETRYRRNDSIRSIPDVRNVDAGQEASTTAVAAVIAAAVLLVITVMIGLGAMPFPN